MKFLKFIVFFFFATFASCKKETAKPVVTRPVKLSHDAYIFSFGFMKSDNSPYVLDDIYGAISGDTIKFVLPAGTDAGKLNPAIEWRGKKISAAAGVAQNFTRPITYTVTAEDSSQMTYTVIVKYRSKLFISSNDGTMHALDALTGTLKMKGSPDLDKPSKSINARIIFSISILSALRLSFDTFSIHSAVWVSLPIISNNWQHLAIAA